MPVKKVVSERGKISYTFVLNNIPNPQSKEFDYYFDNLVIFQNGKNESSKYIIRYEPSEEWFKYWKDFKNYSGKISFFTITGEKYSSFQMADGDILLNTSYDNTKGSCDMIYDGSDVICTQIIDEKGEGWKLSCITTYYYIIECSGGGGGDYNNDNNNDGDGVAPGEFPDTGGGFTPPTLPEPEEDAAAAIEENIDDSKLESCLKKILDSLQGHKHGVGKIIVEFAENDYSTFNWAVKSGNSTTATATATTDINYNTSTTTATTTFNASTFSNGTDISWARTFLHEAVHAYVISVSNASSLTFEERKELLGPNWIIAYINDGHDYIANTYVNSIADVLQEFGQLKGYTMDRQFYEDIAWGGLQGTNAFDNLSSTAQNRILDLIAIELTGKDRNGNHKTQKGTVAGC